MVEIYLVWLFGTQNYFRVFNSQEAVCHIKNTDLEVRKLGGDPAQVFSNRVVWAS
jgi:hypothetical protein